MTVLFDALDEAHCGLEGEGFEAVFLVEVGVQVLLEGLHWVVLLPAFTVVRDFGAADLVYELEALVQGEGFGAVGGFGELEGGFGRWGPAQGWRSLGGFVWGDWLEGLELMELLEWLVLLLEGRIGWLNIGILAKPHQLLNILLILPTQLRNLLQQRIPMLPHPLQLRLIQLQLPLNMQAKLLLLRHKLLIEHQLRRLLEQISMHIMYLLQYRLDLLLSHPKQGYQLGPAEIIQGVFGANHTDLRDVLFAGFVLFYFAGEVFYDGLHHLLEVAELLFGVQVVLFVELHYGVEEHADVL